MNVLENFEIFSQPVGNRINQFIRFFKADFGIIGAHNLCGSSLFTPYQP